MDRDLDILKGISPGLVLERELRKRKLAKKAFANDIGEYPQVLGDIMKGKRRINPRIALKIEPLLGKSEGFFLILQVFHDLEEEKKKSANAATPQTKLFRPVLFWDTDISKLDWNRQKRAIIHRVFEHGNSIEKKELIRFYGKEAVDAVVAENAARKHKTHE